MPATHVCGLLVDKGEALAAQVNATISRCSSNSSITILEGEGVHPSLAQHHAIDLVRFAFVLEPDRAVLLETLISRSVRFRSLPAAHQRTVAQANRLYGQWLRQQAQRYRQPWVESRPWSTLPDRLVQAWQQPILKAAPPPAPEPRLQQGRGTAKPLPVAPEVVTGPVGGRSAARSGSAC